MAVRILAQRHGPTLAGDPALLDLAARSAAGFSRQLGPYSRFGYSHPGPAFFYSAAPAYWLSGYSSRALSVAVELINGVAAASLVVLVGRRAGHVGALLSSATVLLYAWRVDIGLLQVPWNPLVILLPLAVALVAAGMVDRIGLALAVVVLSGTFVVQTHLGTTPVMGVVLVAAVAFAARARRSNTDRPGQRSAGVLFVLAVLLWLPPIWQQLSHHPGNLGLIVHFFRQPNPAGPGLRPAVADTGRELAVLLRGIPYLGSLRSGRPREAWAAVAIAVIVLSLAAVVIGRRVRSNEAAQLGAVSAVAVGVSVLAVHSIRGDVFWYLVAWISAIAVPAVLAWVVLLDRLDLRGTTLVAAAVLVVSLVVSLDNAAGTRLYDNRAFPREPIYRADVAAVSAVVSASLAARHVWERDVLLDSDAASLPALAGLAVRLELVGHTVRVTQDVGVYFGPERVTSHPLPASFWVGQAGATPPADSRLVGETRGFEIWRPPVGWH